MVSLPACALSRDILGQVSLGSNQDKEEPELKLDRSTPGGEERHWKNKPDNELQKPGDTREANRQKEEDG